MGYLVLERRDWFHLDAIEFIVVHLDLEIGAHFDGLGVGQDVMRYVLLVAIEEGEDFLHERLETGLRSLCDGILRFLRVHCTHHELVLLLG
jgi:hypothetical protein